MAEYTTSLRPLTADDTEILFGEVFEGDDPDPSGHLLKGERPTTLAEVNGLVGWLVEGSNGGQLHPFLFLDGDGQVVGWGHITEGEAEAPEISFMIGPRHREHGHAKRAIDLLAIEALTGETTHVEAVVHVENAAVRHLLDGLGFTVISAVNPLANEETSASSRPRPAAGPRHSPPPGPTPRRQLLLQGQVARSAKRVPRGTASPSPLNRRGTGRCAPGVRMACALS